jgi:hypothetical protein
MGESVALHAFVAHSGTRKTTKIVLAEKSGSDYYSATLQMNNGPRS